MAQSIADLMRSSFSFDARFLEHGLNMLWELDAAIIASLRSIAGFLAVVGVTAVLAPLALGGWSFSPNSLSFKWEKLDPIKGLQRVFSWNGAMELLKALAKFLVITGVSVTMLWLMMGRFLATSSESLAQGIADAASLVGLCFVAISAATLLIAAADVPFQIWSHTRKIRMTRQEVKDDSKETEGRPEVRSRIRTLQREIAQRRMMEEVPNADVVLTNPAHFSIALSYEPDTMDAPRLVAKGADLVAFNIRRVAQDNGVPVVCSPALTRSIYYHTKLGQEIPVGLYVAVAQVLAYVFQLRDNPGAEAPPELADGLSVPDELKR